MLCVFRFPSLDRTNNGEICFLTNSEKNMSEAVAGDYGFRYYVATIGTGIEC